MPEQTLIDTAGALVILDVDRSTFTRWVAAGRITPLMRVGKKSGAFVFDRADVEALAEERRAEAAAS